MSRGRLKLGRVLNEVDVRGSSGETVLSVYRDHGVVPKASRDDNFNKTPTDTSFYKLVRPDDFVVNKMKAWQGSIARSNHRGIVSGDYLVCRLESRDVLPAYLHFLLRSQPLIHEYRKRSSGIRPSQWRLYWEDLRQIEIELPALPAQRAIAEFLDAETARIDALITKKRHMIELLNRRTECLVAQCLDVAVEKFGDVPVKAVADLRVSNVDKKSYEDQQRVGLCNYTDVYYNRVIDDSLVFMAATADPGQIRRLTLQAGDVLITKDSEVAEDIAIPALVAKDLPGVVLGYHLAMYRPSTVSGAFLYWVLRSRRSRDAFSLAASGVTRFGLRQDSMTSVRIPMVPAPQQARLVRSIEKQVGTAERVSVKLKRQVDLLQERRQALITAAVTGELEVPGVAA